MTMRFAHKASILVGLLALAACSGEDASPQTQSGATGGSAGAAGSGTGGVAGASGAGGSAGTSGAGGVATGGAPGSGGAAGSGGTVQTGGSAGVAGGSGTGGSAGTGAGSGAGGAAGSGGSAGSGGLAGAGGGAGQTGGSAGAGGAAGKGGSAGAGGTVVDAGKGGSAGTGGAAGTGGTTATDAAGSWWKPTAGLSWQWQIGGGTINPSLAVDVFDIDWEESASIVSQLHQAGKKVICYVSVGSWEDWRPDAASFPAAVLGNNYPGWPGEKFVDIRAQALRDIMAKRFDVCKTKDFDAVEPDNMDVFGNNSGFPLTRADGTNYALWIATECHARGMAVVQKNASEITSSIQSTYDGALTEDCYDGGNWCSDMQPYIDANKPVFACEYNASIFSAACTWGKPKKYSFILKDLDLGAPVTFCP